MEISEEQDTWTSKRKVLTNRRFQISGLEMFGHELGHKQTVLLGEHTHKCMELVYVVSGSQTYVTENQLFVVKGNPVFLTRAGLAHGSGDSPHGRYEIYWFRLSEGPCLRFLNLEEDSGALLQKALCGLETGLLLPGRDLKELIVQSFDLISTGGALDRVQGCALLVQFLCAIVGGSAHTQTVSPEIGLTLTYIQDHIRERISLEELACVCALSVSRFKTRFKQEIQVTPREYVNLKKIEHAKALLREGMSVTETAFLLSFSSSSYFTVLFKAIVGQSPAAYQKSHQA